MDFSWTEEQTSFYEQVAEFSGTLNASTEETAFRQRWRRLGEFGLLGLSVPVDHGGGGHSALMTVRLMEAFGRGCTDAGLVFSAAAHLFACAMPMSQHGSPRVRESIVPKLADGTWIGANAITEAEAGSDVFRLRTRAQRDGDDYLISGEKTYVTNGPVADVFLVYATIEPKWGHLGVTAFAVESSTPGITRGKPFQKVGLSGASLCSVYFDEVRVPPDAVLGRPGQGAMVFSGSMQWERACLFGMYVGIMERDLERCIRHAQERKQGGKRIAEHQAIAHRLVEMKMRLETARMLLYRACWLFDQGRDSTLDVCLAKLCVSESAVQNGLDAIRIFGGSGIVQDMGIDLGLRDALPALIFSGTSEIQRNLVAHAMGIES